jgi:hypothetical protein
MGVTKSFQEALVIFLFFDFSAVAQNLVYVLYKLTIGTYSVTISLGYDFWNLGNPIMAVACELQESRIKVLHAHVSSMFK